MDKLGELVVIAGINSKHYHKPKWVESRIRVNKRLSTVCGRDSAIYDIHLEEKNLVITVFPWLKPCKTCFGKS